MVLLPCRGWIVVLPLSRVLLGGGTSVDGMNRGSSSLEDLVGWWYFRGGDSSWFFLS